MFCNKCGKKINDGSKYCDGCGNKIKNINKNIPETIIPSEETKTILKDELPLPNPEQRHNQSENGNETNSISWLSAKKNDFSKKYKAMSPVQRNKFILLLIILMVSIALYFYIITPKISDVEKFHLKKDSVGLCLLVENNAQTDRYIPVLSAAAKAILEIKDTDALAKLSNLLSNEKNNVQVRIAITDQFAENNIIIPDLFDLIAEKNLNGDVKQAIISAAYKVDSNIFKEKVESELKVATSISQVDDYINAIIKVKTFDVNGEKSDRINTVLYGAYLSKIRQIAYESGRKEIKKSLEEMEQVESVISAKDKERIKSMKRCLSEDDDYDKRLDQINTQEQQARKNIQKANEQIFEINNYLTNCGWIRAFIIDSIGDDTYEITFNLWDSTNRAVLKTHVTSFSTKGWFEMYATNNGYKRISLRNGGTANWEYFEENTDAQSKIINRDTAISSLQAAQDKLSRNYSDRAELNNKHRKNNSIFYQLLGQLGLG